MKFLRQGCVNTWTKDFVQMKQTHLSLINIRRKCVAFTRLLPIV